MRKASSVSGEGRREGSKDVPARRFLPGKGFFFPWKGERPERGQVRRERRPPARGSRCPRGSGLRLCPTCGAVIYGDSPNLPRFLGHSSAVPDPGPRLAGLQEGEGERSALAAPPARALLILCRPCFD